jgi:hypothetical protein
MQPMAIISPSESRTQKRHIREQATIDHLVNKTYEPRVPQRRVCSATTETGLPIADQVCKEWDPSYAGLPMF